MPPQGRNYSAPAGVFLLNLTKKVNDLIKTKLLLLIVMNARFHSRIIFQTQKIIGGHVEIFRKLPYLRGFRLVKPFAPVDYRRFAVFQILCDAVARDAVFFDKLIKSFRKNVHFDRSRRLRFRKKFQLIVPTI